MHGHIFKSLNYVYFKVSSYETTSSYGSGIWGVPSYSITLVHWEHFHLSQKHPSKRENSIMLRHREEGRTTDLLSSPPPQPDVPPPTSLDWCLSFVVFIFCLLIWDFISQIYIYPSARLSTTFTGLLSSTPMIPVSACVPHALAWLSWATQATAIMSLLQQIHDIMALFQRTLLVLQISHI